MTMETSTVTEKKERLFDVRDIMEREVRIREYLGGHVSFDEQCTQLPRFDEEREKFFDELCDNLSKLRIVDFVVSYNEYDKTLDSVWKLIGGYKLSVAQFFTENPDDVNDGLAVCSIHSPEKELLVSADMTVEEVCRKLLEVEGTWSEAGQPERICEKFGRFDMQKFTKVIEAERELENRKREPVRVGQIIKRMFKKFGLWKKSC